MAGDLLKPLTVLIDDIIEMLQDERSAGYRAVIKQFDEIYRREYRMVSTCSADSVCNELLNRIRRALLEELK